MLLVLLIHLQCVSDSLGQLDPTTLDPPHACANYGLCKSNPTPSVMTYTCPAGNCLCQNGTTGDLCETMLTPCESGSPCPNANYDCTDEITGPVCTCGSSFTGSNCDIPISSPCANSPCLNGGTCSSPDNTTAKCSCSNGYQTPFCQFKDPCAGSPCKNGGTCTSIYGGQDYFCQCTAAYYDRTCNTPMYTWAANSAVNKGCYAYDSSLTDASKYLLITDNNAMTYSKCQNLLETGGYVPPYTMFTVQGKNCYLSRANYLNSSSVQTGGNCNQQCPGDNSQKCGSTSGSGGGVVIWSVDSTYTTASPQCVTNPTACGPYGTCVSLPTTSVYWYMCICQLPYKPTTAGTACTYTNPCSSNPCLHSGVCTVGADQTSYTCACTAGYVGATCQYLQSCEPNPCKYDGTCIDNQDGTYKCQCLPHYTGTICNQISACEYADPCQNNATCTNLGTGIQIWPKCTCQTGYTGVNCELIRDLCTELEPCWHNSTCKSGFMSYTCSCIPGTTGQNCSTLINMCQGYKDSNGNWIKSQCNSKDSAAQCISGTNDTINTFTCSCSTDWTQPLCDLNKIIEQVMMTIYGKMDPTMLPLLNNLLQTPAMIADMVPFIIGTLTPDERANLSWSMTDMFYNSAYEEKELVLSRDFFQWNDVVLGNCFTFNHPNGSQFYNMRSSEYQGGLRARLKLNQGEYAPWTDTASILVFIHFKDDYIMSESIRYNAEPNNEVIFFPFSNEYTRLGGQYGTCVNSISEVKAFYFPGAYTTDGCLRSCYQDMIEKNCSCMDPRYPMPAGKISCAVSNMTCIDDASEKNGDPSTWRECICPLPCTNTDFSITWTKSSYRMQTPNCLDPKTYNWDATCQKNTADSVIVQVHLAELTFNLFQETPNMDFNKLIGSLGALLGVLMGICAITFIEIIVMVLRVIWSITCKPRKQ